MMNTILDPASWSARKTDDGRISVVDVIAAVTGKSHNYAAQIFQRLVAEERVTPVGDVTLPARAECMETAQRSVQKTHRGGARPKATPVATAAQMVEIIWQLPGTAEFRRNCAQVCVRYLGGDLSLVDEITANRAAQERLRQENPSHPARIFGEAVEKPEGLRQLRLQNDELEQQILKNARQALVDAGFLDEAQDWMYRDRLSNLLRGEAGVAQVAQQTTHTGEYLAGRLSAAQARRWRCKFGCIAARLKRQAEGLERGAQLPKATKNVDGNPTQVVVYRWPQEQALLEAAYAELQRQMPRVG